MDDLPFRAVVYAGRTWTVREVDVTNLPWAHGDRCLICEDGAVVRRFWVYPEDWRCIDGDDLARFCQDARPSTFQPLPSELDRPRRADSL